MDRLIVSCLALLASSSICQADAVNVRCATTTVGGQVDPITISIDIENRTVKMQFSDSLYTYRDGVVGRANAAGAFFGQQFVLINEVKYTWGISGKYTATIDRATGVLIANGRHYPCSLIRGF
jgi:hypothetical protein